MNKINSLKKKIKYRSEYRGIKEMDLLLGKFVNKYIDSFNYDELMSLYEILETLPRDEIEEALLNVLLNKHYLGWP